jgi:hypothetical protein
VFARLRNGVTAEQAHTTLQPYMRAMLELESKDAAFTTASAETRKKFIETRLVVESIARGKSGLRDSVTVPLKILMAVASGVLLIACLNVANLLLARGTARHRELALRLALGASRGRIVGLLLVESLLVALFGAIGGLLLAWWGSGLLLTFYSTADNPIAVSPSPDARILVFTMLTATLAAILAGLVPAWASTRLNLAPTLKSSGGAVVGEQPRLRKSFVVAQVALSFLLLAGAGVFLRSLTNLLKVDTGMKVDHVLAFSVDLARSGYTAPRDRQFADRLVQTLQHTPGVTSVGYGFFGVLEGGAWGMGFTLEGRQPKPGQFFGALCNAITPGFFPTLGVQLVAGRNFTERDARTPPPDEKGWPYRTAIVNEEFVKKYYDGVNPIGRHIGFGEDPGTANAHRDRRRGADVEVRPGPRGTETPGLLPVLRVFRDRARDDLPADDGRSRRDDRADPTAGRLARPGPAGLQPAHARGAGGTVRGERPADCQPVDRVQPAGDGAGDGGPLRRDGLHGDAADARDRHPHGARGPGVRRRASDPERGRRARGHRPGARRRRRAVAWPVRPEPALWAEGDGHADVRERRPLASSSSPRSQRFYRLGEPHVSVP